MKLARGQVWSILDNAGGRIEVRIVRLHGNSLVLETLGTAARRMRWRKTFLSNGRRGARLVDAGHPWRDHTILKERITGLRVFTQQEKRSASDLRRAEGPRGIARADGAVAEAMRLQAEGLTYGQIAARMGCSRGTVAMRLARGREAQTDARHIKALG